MNRVGAPAVFGAGNSFWNAKPCIKQTKKPKIPKQVLYPLFAECAAICDDPYWETIFNESSFGKFPKKFTMKDGDFIFKKQQRKVETLKIPSNPHEAASALKEFIAKHGGLISELDKEISERLIEERMISESQNSINLDWESFDNKVKTLLLEMYIDEVATVQTLSSHERSKLKYILFNENSSGGLSDANVVIVNGCINSITGLSFCPENRKFCLVATRRKTKSSRSTAKTILPNDDNVEEDVTYCNTMGKDSVPTFYKKWCKRLSDLAPKTVTPVNGYSIDRSKVVNNSPSLKSSLITESMSETGDQSSDI